MLAIAAVAGALVAGGCVSAAAKPPAAAAAASARAATAAGGTANIMIYGVNTDGARWHAIISGVIGGYGPAVSIYPDGQVDPAHNSEMELRLTHGSFRLSIAALEQEIREVGQPRARLPEDMHRPHQRHRDHPARGGLRQWRLPRDQRQVPGHPHAERGRGEAVPAKPRRVPRATDHSGRLGDHLVLRHRNWQGEQVRQPTGRPAVVAVSVLLATTVVPQRRAAVWPSRRPARSPDTAPRRPGSTFGCGIAAPRHSTRRAPVGDALWRPECLPSSKAGLPAPGEST